MAESQVKRPYHRKSDKLELVRKLCKNKGYFIALELKPHITSKKKNSYQVYANRLVEDRYCYPGNFKPQQYYLTPEEANQAVAEKPPRKPTDFSKLSKCQVMQASPSNEKTHSQNREITLGNTQNQPSSYCTNLTFDNLTIVTAADMATESKHHIRHNNYGMLGTQAYNAYGSTALLPQLLDTLDNMPTIPLTVHNLGWTFNTPIPDASLFADIPLQNRLLPGSLTLPDGTPVTFQRYDSGKVNVQAMLTYTPIDPNDISQLMDSIRSFLPFETPTTDHWTITTTDAAYDIPISAKTLRGFKLPEFDYHGSKIHAYRKKINGKWHLRVESHEHPNTPLSDYPSYIEAVAIPRIQGACGK